MTRSTLTVEEAEHLRSLLKRCFLALDWAVAELGDRDHLGDDDPELWDEVPKALGLEYTKDEGSLAWSWKEMGKT